MRSLGVGRCLTARLTVFLLTWAAAHNPSEAASHWQNVLMGLTTPNPVGIRAHVAHPFRFAALRYRSVSPLRTKKSCFKLTHQVRKVLTVLPTVFLLVAFLASVWTTGSLQASVPRYSVDMQNSRRISDNLEETEFPFQKLWQTDLEGTVESQPIICDGRIYVQAGDRLLRLDMKGTVTARSPSLSDSPMPSGSSPTYAETVFGDRIYQATRDHRLWALDPGTLEPLWPGDYVMISAGGRPDLHYRITSSPLVITEGGRTFIALGTGNGDQTGRTGQYADNGFFILEDRGETCEVVYSRQAAGEVTGSPLLSRELIVATQNIVTGRNDEENLLLCFDLSEMKEIENTPRTPQGIPGSPAEDQSRLYIADRQGRMYCYQKEEKTLSLLWETAPPEGRSSYNLNSPTIGDHYVYLPIRQYNHGGGLLAVYDKNTGAIEKTLAFNSLLCSNVVYWHPGDSAREYLLVYEASGRTMLLDAVSLEPVKGFMDEENRIIHEIMLPRAPSGVKAPEPIIGENHILLVDGAGLLHAYYGRGKELEITIDLAVQAFQTPDTVDPGEGARWTALIENLSEEPAEQAILEWSLDGQVLHRETVDLDGGEKQTKSYDWPGTGKPGIGLAEVSILPQVPVIDIDESNNFLRRYIQVRQPQTTANCADLREKGEWQVTYAVLVGYKTRTYTTTQVDSEGITTHTTHSYTDYNSPIYHYVEVEYKESLSATLTMHTGQGRLPDPAKPSPEDREGRGAWEIIPYAKARGLDPNQITRAGAGFSLKVETAYSTDWETKVPPRAEAIGGVLNGPDKVTAEFYDTRGKLVKSLALERTEGTSGAGKAVWQLPETKYTHLDGSTISDRRFYTAPDIPDGEYQVLIRAEGAGLHKLYTCKVGRIRIYGSIYDDIQERSVRP